MHVNERPGVIESGSNTRRTVVDSLKEPTRELKEKARKKESKEGRKEGRKKERKKERKNERTDMNFFSSSKFLQVPMSGRESI